ncbi:MAG: ABC transporter substrate-binding protein [Bowdeniella nasicola]|nr:ABC transporter substrate-binding protein [Bowdeniella nasicola]
MRRFKAMAIAAVVSLGLAACGSGSEDSSAGDNGDSAGEGDAGKTIYLVSKGFQHRFWQAVKEGAEEAGEELGYTIEFVGPDNEQAITQQLDQLKTALNTKPAAIGFAALDSEAAAPVLEQIKAADIPVIAFDSGVESDIPLTTVQTDNKAAAGEAAKHMAELLDNEGKVGLVCHDQTSQTGKDRCFGFKDWMKENAPDIEVIDEQYAGEVGKAADVAKAIIASNPDIAGMYGTNEAAAIGVVQGVKESGNANITVVGFDSGKAQLDAIRDGLEAGAVTQSPVKMGYETVKAAIAAINGESLDEIIDSGFAWYDKDNMDDDDIKANLYE